MYRQHNSPDRFQSYFEETIEKLTSSGKQLYIVGDFNIDLLKFETSRYSHDFLVALQSCYLISTIDKPTHVRNNSATLIDNIFVNNPEQVHLSGNLITDLSDTTVTLFASPCLDAFFSIIQSALSNSMTADEVSGCHKCKS